MKLSIAMGVVVALAFVGRAQAGEPVYTDNGWYSVEGEATPTTNAGEGTLEVVPAPPKPVVTRATNQEVTPPPAPPAEEEAPAMAGAPACVEERGALARRILELHGLEVSRTQLTDAELGMMPATAMAQANGLNGTVGIDPDLNALQGNVPIPPSSANWDQEVRQRFMDLAACQARQ